MAYYTRAESLQRALLAEAERLLALKKRPKRARGTTNVIDPPADVPTRAQAEHDMVVEALTRRLAKRDATGGGSGEPG